MNAHLGLSDAENRRLDAALVLLLANHVADAATLSACVQAARAAAQTQENT